MSETSDTRWWAAHAIYLNGAPQAVSAVTGAHTASANAVWRKIGSYVVAMVLLFA